MRARHARWAPLALLGTVALGAGWLAPYDPAATDGPVLAGPSREHLLGTTALGQDVLSRVVVGSRVSLAVALAVIVGVLVVGVVAGGLAAVLGGVVDVVVTRVVDVALAVPRVPFLLIVTGLAGPATLSLVVAVVALAWAPVARVVAARVRQIRGSGYLAAARGLGVGEGTLLVRHVLPATAPVLAAEIVAVGSIAVLLQATVAFLGLAPEEQISWGADLHRSLTEPGALLSTTWVWWGGANIVAVALAIGAFALAGSGLERATSRRST